jgi:hypothetical protein
MKIRLRGFTFLAVVDLLVLSLNLNLMLRPTVSRSVYLAIKHPSVAYDHIFITARQLQDC